MIAGFCAGLMCALAWWWWRVAPEEPRGYVPATSAQDPRDRFERGRPGWRNLGRGSRASPPPGSRLDEPEVASAEAIELLRLALDSGLSTGPALGAVADVIDRRRTADHPSGGSRTARELRSVAAAHAWGMDAERAWSQVGARWGPARQAMILADRSGVPAAGLLGHAAAEARRERSARLQVAAAKLPIRLVIPLGLLYLPAFMLITVVPLVLALARGILQTW